MDFDVETFQTALTTRFSMDEDDAKAVVTLVEDLFWGEDEVNDEDLDKETRSMFYTLQAEGILPFRRTEYKFEGATRRAFFWRLREDVLEGLDNEDALKVDDAMDHDAKRLYATLNDDMWNRGHVAA